MARPSPFPIVAPVLALLTAVALLATAAPAAAAPRDDGGPLVYVFSLDGLDGDEVDAGSAPFLASLLRGAEGARGTYWRESRATMVAETNPNHVAMATGAFAERSGIPGNAFAVYDAAAKATCPAGGTADPPGLPPAEDPPAGGPQETDGEAAQCLLAESFFTATARGRDAAKVTTAGIFGKPKLARIFATRRAVAAPRYDADHLWAPCETPDDDTPYCRLVPVNPASRYALTDGIVMDEVLRTVRDGVPADGAVKRPNLTFVNFPTIDSVGHATGAEALYTAAIGETDAELRRFVAQQKALGLWGRTVVLVVSDHSMETTAVKSSLKARLDLAGIPAEDYLVVQNGSLDMVYLTDPGRPDRDALLARMRQAALSLGAGLAGDALSMTDEALYRDPNPLDGGTAHTLDGRHPGWRLAGPRTGHLVVTHQVGGAFSDPANPLTGNHGGPQTTDNFMAAVGGGAFVRQQQVSGTVAPRFDDTLLNPGQAQTVDVAPTALWLLGRGAPADSQGRVLTEAFDAKRLPKPPR